MAGKFEHLITDLSQRTILRLYVIGDFGSGDRWQVRVADAMAFLAEREPPDLILSTGDCLYPLDEAGDIGAASPATVLAERFDPHYAGLGVDFFQCLGNHDLLDVFGGDASLMIDHTMRSPVWRMPATSYRIPSLPPWIAIHVANTNVFGFGGYFAEAPLFSEPGMEQEVDALRDTFARFDGLKLLVGHHPVFTPGKRTYRYNGDGEVLYMRRLRRAIEACGVHFYFSGHEHQQSHVTGPACEYVVQGCGGVGFRPNARHQRRQNGWRDMQKALRYHAVLNGFAVLEADVRNRIRLRFFGIAVDEPANAVHVVHERRWAGLDEIGDPALRPLSRVT